MAGRPPKTLATHVLEETFRARRHHELLAGAELPWPAFALLQARYRAATSYMERRAIAVEFENAVGLAHDATHTRLGTDEAEAWRERLADLGESGSLDQLLAFFPTYLHHTSGPRIGQPFTLEQWQRAFLCEFHRRDENGERIYRRGVLGLPCGNGKTTLTAGLALYELLAGADAPEVYLATARGEQARIARAAAHAFATQEPLAGAVVSRGKLTMRGGRGAVQVIAADGAAKSGWTPSAAIIDDLGEFRTQRQQATYTALTTSLHKRLYAYLLAISTASKNKDSLLGRIWEDARTWPDVELRDHGCLTIARNEARGVLLWWYGAPHDADPDDPTILRATNPASWVSPRDLQQQLRDPALPKAEFRRLHLNQWPPDRESTAIKRATTGSSRAALATADNRRYPGASPEGSEGVDDGRSRSSSSEDALSHHPHRELHRQRRPAVRTVRPAVRHITPTAASKAQSRR